MIEKVRLAICHIARLNNVRNTLAEPMRSGPCTHEIRIIRWFRYVASRFAVFVIEAMKRICGYADGLKRPAIARLQSTWLASVIFLETDVIFGYNVRKSRRIWNANRFSISIRWGVRMSKLGHMGSKRLDPQRDCRLAAD